MISVYDVQLELHTEATVADVLKLKDHFKVLKIESIGLDPRDLNSNPEELSFSIYGDFAPFMMRKMLQECAQNIFPGSVVGLSQRS